MDDERCTAWDISGNLGGECACSGCASATITERPLPFSPVVMVSPPDTSEPRAALARAEAARGAGPIVMVEPVDRCACGMDLNQVRREGKIGHVCSAIKVEGPFRFEITVPAIEVREAALEYHAREFHEASPSFYEVKTQPDRTINHDARRAKAAELRRAALQYAAEYLARDAERYGGDYYEAIAELRDPTIPEVK